MSKLIPFKVDEVSGKRILQCHPHGDIRFSQFHARVTAFEIYDTIENHYQLSKVFYTPEGEEVISTDAYEARFMTKPPEQGGYGYTLADHFVLPDYVEVPTKYILYGWYTILWLKYLDQNQDLVRYAAQFDDYEDIFKGRALLCSADCIRLYVKSGRDSLKQLCLDFLEYLKDPEAGFRQLISERGFYE